MGEVFFIDKTGKGAICNGRVCIRVKKDVKFQGHVKMELEEMVHIVTVKEIGCWMPIF